MKQYLTTLTSTKHHRPFMFIAAFALLGTILLLRASAATPNVSVESEKGTITSGASVVSDGTASAGKAVRFNAPTPPPPPPPPPKTTIFSYTNVGNSTNFTSVVNSLPSVVTGVSWVFRWKDIEPNAPVGAQHSYNWTLIDKALAAAKASGRQSMIRVIAGQFSPSWATPAVTFSFKPLGPEPYQTITMPIPWSANFLANWTAFIQAYGTRYDHDSRIRAVQMPGAGRLGEMNIGNWSGWTSTAPPPDGMGSDPATDEKLITAWNRIIDAYRGAFPDLPSVLDLGDPLGDGVIQPAVLSHASSYGRKIYFQQNGLKANLQGKYPTLLKQLSATTTVGWQTWGGNNTVTDLQNMFTIAINSHASYVEVYLNDCTNPANLSALQYLANN